MYKKKVKIKNKIFILPLLQFVAYNPKKERHKIYSRSNRWSTEFIWWYILKFIWFPPMSLIFKHFSVSFTLICIYIYISRKVKWKWYDLSQILISYPLHMIWEERLLTIMVKMILVLHIPHAWFKRNDH